MGAYWEDIVTAFQSLSLSWTDIIDILLVAYLVYKGIVLLRETRAEQLVKGLIILLVAYFFADNLSMKTISFVIQNILNWGIIALVVVFQPEIRRALEQVGRSKLGKLNVFNNIIQEGEGTQETLWGPAITAICNAAGSFAMSKTGALIVIERQTKLKDIAASGTFINADISEALLGNLFFKDSPLHDGAVIVKDGRVYAAGCFLPLSTTNVISKQLGTRHRAALGVSENSDALVIVVSEETGAISWVNNGVLRRGVDVLTLKGLLEKSLLPQTEEGKEKKTIFRKVRHR